MTESLDSIARACAELERQRRLPNVTMAYGFEKFNQPQPAQIPGALKLLEQATAIIDSEDDRVNQLVEDFGGAQALAQLAAALWLAGMDKLNGIELVKKMAIAPVK